MGFASELSRWAWPVAADAALELDDVTAVEELLDQVLSLPAGNVSALARAEARRVRARLLARQQDPTAPAAFEASTDALRAVASPWHLARGLADHADFCASVGDRLVAQTLADESRQIADGLRARPLLARLDGRFATTSHSLLSLEGGDP